MIYIYVNFWITFFIEAYKIKLIIFYYYENKIKYNTIKSIIKILEFVKKTPLLNIFLFYIFMIYQWLIKDAKLLFLNLSLIAFNFKKIWIN